MTARENREILTQHFIELSEKIKDCKDYRLFCQLTELLIQMYDRLQK